MFQLSAKVLIYLKAANYFQHLAMLKEWVT